MSVFCWLAIACGAYLIGSFLAAFVAIAMFRVSARHDVQDATFGTSREGDEKGALPVAPVGRQRLIEANEFPANACDHGVAIDRLEFPWTRKQPPEPILDFPPWNDPYFWPGGSE